MPFKPLIALLRTVNGWFHPQAASHRAGANHARVPALRSTFRRLEKRRVFAVDAFFVGGALDIQISSVGETNANLLADGSDFFVDTNNNFTFELGETRGSIADLQCVHAFSNDSIGKLFWNGDFSLAPLAVPLGTGNVIRTEGLSQVHLQAPFHAGGNVSFNALNAIDFDASIFVQGNLSATVSPGGTILDGPNAAITISGDVFLQSQNAILLGDEATSSWSVVDLSNIVSQGDVQLGLVGNWDSTNIRAIGNDITIVDHNAVSIVEIQSSGDFELTALGSVTDQSSAKINIGGTAVIQGASIDLANDASDVFHVSGGVSLIASSGPIAVESPGTVTLGNISASGTSVTLFEDADMALASIQTPGLFAATSTGSITDIAGANVQAATMNLNAAGSILLSDNATDVLSVVGRSFLSAANRIDIESAGLVNFGSLGLVGTQALVYEDSSTQLDGSILSQFELHARDSVTQSGVNTGAGTAVLQIAGPVHVSLLGAPGDIDFYRASSSPPTAISDGRLLDNQISGLFTADGINGDFRLRNVSSQAAIGLLSGSFDDLTIWHTQASVILPNQVFNVLGNLELIAGVDILDPVPMLGNSLNRILNSSAVISDSGTILNVGGNAHFAAAADISLGDATGETLSVTSGSTSIVSLGGGQIMLGQVGTVLLSELGVYSKSLLDGHRGDFVAQLDASVALVNPNMPIPDGSPLQFTANNVSLDINGDLSNAPGTQIVLGGNFIAVVSNNINFIGNANDTLRVAGISELTSTSGSIALGFNGTVELNDANFKATSGNVVVGGAGHTKLGVIEARGADVAIQEDADMVVRAAIASNRLVLSSALSITNTVAFVPNGTQGISAKGLTIEAGTFAHLGPISVDRITATVLANGTLNNSGLFGLNAEADRNGQSYLDAVGENLPPNVSPVDQLWSGESLDELRSRASFIQSFGREYGLFVQNSKELTVEAVQATGDGIHVLIETALGTDLIVGGDVTQRFTQNDPGGVVLIAGENLILNAGAELRIENVSQDLATSRVIQQPNLIANAFDGGRGPAGYESTRDVLYAADAFADTGIQNVLQRVSTQFGVRGEAGFQTLIRYADGSSQLFDANEELSVSLQSNPSGNARAGVIPAFVSSTGDAAIVERATPYSDTFLGTFQTLPTTAIFRRSAEFFLFEHAGAIDASVTKVDLTPVVDLVDHVLSPGRKISFSLPTEIVVTPAILVAPIRIAPDTPSSFPSLSSDQEPSVLGDAKFEVFIVNVGFDDKNRDGQPSDPELPSRNEVQIDAVVPKSKSTDLSDKQNEEAAPKRAHLAPGEPNTLTKEIKSSKSPTAADINSWIEEYRNDPTKPSGAYAVISVDSVTGAKVLRVFGVRDFEVADPEPSRQNDSIEKQEVQPEDNAPKGPDDNDKTTSNDQQHANSNVVQLESQSKEDMKELVMGIAAGTFWTVSKEGGNRFGRLARSQRAMRRIHAESQNDPVS